MKRNCILLIVGLTALAFQSQPFDFRQTAWNMTKEQVVAAEKDGKPVVNTQDMIRYDKVAVAQDTFTVNYEFAANKLVRAEYFYRPVNMNQKECLKTYNDLEKVLVKKYGSALGPVSLNVLAKRVPNQPLAFAGVKKSFIYKIWEKPRTFVALQYTENGRKDSCAIVVAYISKILPAQPRPKGYQTKDF